MTNDVGTRVTMARGILQTARENLDEVVAGLPDGGADNAMATPAVLALLLRVVEARRRLDGLELLLSHHPQVDPSAIDVLRGGTMTTSGRILG
jgi:hypothetical protein